MWELQKALYALLSGALDVPVYASAPQDAALPYVDMGEADSVPADVQCRDGLEETITAHVWTAYGSQQPAKEIIQAILDSVHLQNLTVAGRSAAMAAVTSTRLFPDADNASLHGVVSIRVTHFGP